MNDLLIFNRRASDDPPLEGQGITDASWNHFLTFVQKFVSMYLADAAIFHRINENVDLLAAPKKEQSGSRKVIRIHPLGNINVCTEFHGNPFQ